MAHQPPLRLRFSTAHQRVRIVPGCGRYLGPRTVWLYWLVRAVARNLLEGATVLQRLPARGAGEAQVEHRGLQVVGTLRVP